MYDLWDQHKNQAGVGIKKGWGAYRIPLIDILNGRKVSATYTKTFLKKRLLIDRYLTEDCSICGWNEPRITDNKICLTLDYIDGNSDNKSLENMRLLCPNCYLSNNGFFHSSGTFCK